MAKRPVSAMGNKRPISEYARRAAALGGNPRYKVRNPRYKVRNPRYKVRNPRYKVRNPRY